jgi:hypothetical protein
MHSKKTVGQNPTFQKRSQLVFDEMRNRAVPLRLPGQKAFQMLGDNSIERIIFRQALRKLHTKVFLHVKPSAFMSGGIPLGIGTCLSFVGS